MKNFNVLITGGAGFIGSQLGNYLNKQNCNVILLDNISHGYKDNLIINNKTFGKFIYGDVRWKNTLYEILLTEKIEIIFHFAGISSLPLCEIDPQNAISQNVAATANVLDCARRSEYVKKIIFSSTNAIYENTENFPTLTSDKSKPDLIYASTKYMAEMLCDSYVKNYNMNICKLRFANVYGPHQDIRRPMPPFTSYIVKCALQNITPVFYSHGYQKRDYIYIDDVVKICYKIMISSVANTGAYNVSSNLQYSVREIYEIFKTILGDDLKKPEYKNSIEYWNKYPELYKGNHPLYLPRIAKEVDKETLCNNEQLSYLFGWTPQVSLREGLEKIVNYARSVLKDVE